MAKTIYGPVRATCISAEPATPAKALEWSSWRQDYVGLTGTLKIYVSQRKSSGRPFLCFYEADSEEWRQEVNCDDAYRQGAGWWLKTYYGEPYFDGDELTFLTNKTRYVFRLLKVQ